MAVHLPFEGRKSQLEIFAIQSTYSSSAPVQVLALQARFWWLRSDSVPRAGCPVVNLRQTLDDLTRNGYSVCIVEEVQGPTQARSRKGRFISGHARPGSPYVFGLVGVDHDLEFPEPMPVVGISQSARVIA
ncbi:hypothetical protein NC651_023998 [Populus alba x Populus x berolinensis]|nr:hypothetical protein NC651_023998 [Populus alba x Populus x berolinensis]